MLYQCLTAVPPFFGTTLLDILQKRREELKDLLVSKEVVITIKNYFVNQDLYDYGTSLIDTFYFYLRLQIANKTHVLDFNKGKHLYKEQKLGQNQIKIQVSIIQLMQMEIQFMDADGDVDGEEISNDDILETVKFDASFLEEQKQMIKLLDKKEKFRLNIYIEKLNIPVWILE